MSWLLKFINKIIKAHSKSLNANVTYMEEIEVTEVELDEQQ